MVSPAGSVAIQQHRPTHPVDQPPAGEVDSGCAWVDQGRGLRLWCRPDRVHQGGDDAHGPVRLGRRRVRAGPQRIQAGNGMSGPVVGVPGLALEREQDRDPLVLGGEVHQQAAVLPGAVVGGEPAAVALVHVNVVDAVSWREAEDLVRHAGSGPHRWPKANRRALGIHRRPRDIVRELVGKVVVRSGCCRGHRPHRVPVEEVSPDEVQGQAAGCTGQRGEAISESRQLCSKGWLNVSSARKSSSGGDCWDKTLTATRKSVPAPSTRIWKWDCRRRPPRAGPALGRPVLRSSAAAFRASIRRGRCGWSAAGGRYRCRAPVPSS